MPTFKTIHTTFGLAAMSAAEASGVPINLTHMAVGDGNGNPVTPDPDQTALAREKYRATINRVYQPDSASDPTLYAAELVVPASEAGFVLREVGLFTADGDLFLIGNLPDTYKPNASEGSYADTVVRVLFRASNDSIITLLLDPSVAGASQQWVLNNITVCYLLPGGTTGQILRKASNGCGDTEWADPTDTNVIVNTVEEEQTLAAAQVNVDLTLTNTTGLAVYIEGVRLPKRAGAGGWQPDGAISTRVILGNAYPAGSKFIGVQNEPASDLPDALVKSQNLSDLQSASTSRTNLDVYSKAETDQKAPPGLVATFARNTAPTGWLKANGALVSRTSYAALFSAIGTTFGAGDGSTTFALPDARGEFIRGWDDSRGIDTGRVFGSSQAHQTEGLYAKIRKLNTDDIVMQTITTPSWAGNYGTSGDGTRTPDTSNTGVSIGALGTDETRPRNLAMLVCIKF